MVSEEIHIACEIELINKGRKDDTMTLEPGSANQGLMSM